MADSSTRWADCSSSGEEDDEGFFDRGNMDYRSKPTREDTSSAPARPKSFTHGKEDHLRRPQHHESDSVGMKPSQYRQHYYTKQQPYRQFGSKSTNTNISGSSYRGSAKGDDEALDWKTLARKSSKILQKDTSSSLLPIQQRSSSGSGPLGSDPMEVSATSWIEKRQMKEQKRIQEEVKKAEQASKILKEEKRLRLKQQAAGLRAALSSIQRAEPSTAATNSSVLDPAAKHGSSTSTLHPTYHEKIITPIETAAVIDQTAKQEEKTQHQREQKLHQMDRQQAFHNDKNKQPHQTQQQQEVYPTKILSKPRQDLVPLSVSSESCAIENSNSPSELPDVNTTNPTVTISGMDRSVPFKDDELDAKNQLMQTQSSVQVMIRSEHKKKLADKDKHSTPGYSHVEQAGGKNRVIDSSTTDRYEDKARLRVDRLKEDRLETPISLNDKVKVSSVNEPVKKHIDDLQDKDDHGNFFSLVNSSKPHPTKRIAKQSSVKGKERIQSFKKGNVPAEKNMNEPVEDEHKVTVRIVMPDGSEIKQQASIGAKDKNQSQSAAITTASVSTPSKQSKYASNDNMVEKKATSGKVKRFPKPEKIKNHGPEMTEDKKRLDAKLDQTERVTIEKLDHGSHLTKKYFKEPKIKRGNLQKIPQDEKKNGEPSLPPHVDTPDSKRFQDVVEPIREADLDTKANSLSLGHAKDAAKSLQVTVSSPQQSILEDSSEKVNISEMSSSANTVSTTLHPSGKSVSFNKSKTGIRPRRGGASYPSRGRPSTDGRRVASTASVEPNITAQASSVIEKASKDLPQSVSDLPNSKCQEGLSNSGSIVDQVEKVERDQGVKTIPTGKERFCGDVAIPRRSAAKFKKSLDGHSITTNGQSARGRGRSATPRRFKTSS